MVAVALWWTLRHGKQLHRTLNQLSPTSLAFGWAWSGAESLGSSARTHLPRGVPPQVSLLLTPLCSLHAVSAPAPPSPCTADASFEELFVRVVPMEVCCIHNSGSSAKHPQQQKPAACLHHSSSSSAHAHFQEASLMPCTPNGSRSCRQGNRNLDAAAGLYPTLSSTEVPGACFCPNCCSNSYMTPEQSAVNTPGLGLAADAEGLASVALQRLTVRVLGQKTRFGANGRQLPGCYRIELSSDSSLFFLFVGTITEAGFLDIKVPTHCGGWRLD